MSEESGYRPRDENDAARLRAIWPLLLLMAAVFGLLNFLGDLLLLRVDDPASDLDKDAGWHALLFFVALAAWAAFDRWRSGRSPRG